LVTTFSTPCKQGDLPIMEFDGTIQEARNRCCRPTPISAPSDGRKPFRRADVVITGRASDPACFLAPMIHAFGWAMDDWNCWGRAPSPAISWNAPANHRRLFCRSPYKDTPDLARLGLSIAKSRGRLAGRHQGQGKRGAVTAQTCKEQLLYEVHDPRQYIHPPWSGFFAKVRVEEIGPDGVRVRAAAAANGPARLKVSSAIRQFYRRGADFLRRPGRWRRQAGLEIVRERLK